MGIIIIPIIQMKKLKLQSVKSLTQGYRRGLYRLFWQIIPYVAMLTTIHLPIHAVNVHLVCAPASPHQSPGDSKVKKNSPTL